MVYFPIPSELVLLSIEDKLLTRISVTLILNGSNERFRAFFFLNTNQKTVVHDILRP